MYGLVPLFLPFVLARLAWGTCFSVLRLGSFTVVMSTSRPSTRGRLVGVYQSVSRIGSVASLLLGSMLVETIGYQAAFVILGLATTPAILLTLLIPERAYHPPAGGEPLHPLLDPPHTRAPLGLRPIPRVVR